ncbi:MAG TPA: DUF2079 domain-containing protein, partial [Polyangiaceae bacterium]
MAGPTDEEAQGESRETPPGAGSELAAEQPAHIVPAAPEASAAAPAAPGEASAASDAPASDVPVSDVPASDAPASDVPASDTPASDTPASPLLEESPPLFPQHPWSVMARVLALSCLLGVALSGWAQLSIKSSWVPEFLTNNARGEQERKLMIALLGAGLAVGGAAGVGLLTWLRKRGREAELERWLWFLVPGILLPAVPALFRAKPWQNRHDALLPIVLLLTLLFEALVLLSLRSVPRAAREFWQQTLAQVPRVVRQRGPLVIVIAAALGYACFFSFFLLRWHYKLRTGNFDLSINNNLMFGGLYGDFLKSPVAFPTDPGKYLAAHAKFGHYLFLPIYALVPRPETLLVIQATLIGAGSIPLFMFARRHLAEWSAAALALAYLAYYPMHGATFSEFQNVPIAALFVFLVVWAAD